MNLLRNCYFSKYVFFVNASIQLYLHGIETHISNVGINKMQLSPVIYCNYPCFFIRM